MQASLGDWLRIEIMLILQNAGIYDDGCYGVCYFFIVIIITVIIFAVTFVFIKSVLIPLFLNDLHLLFCRPSFSSLSLPISSYPVPSLLSSPLTPFPYPLSSPLPHRPFISLSLPDVRTPRRHRKVGRRRGKGGGRGRGGEEGVREWRPGR